MCGREEVVLSVHDSLSDLWQFYLYFPPLDDAAIVLISLIKFRINNCDPHIDHSNRFSTVSGHASREEIKETHLEEG